MKYPEQPVYIDSFQALHAFCLDIRGVEWVALDTEFLRERTYYPKFCLLQVATADRVACIDPLVIEDLSPLDPILDDPRLIKIFHAARQDLEILYRIRRKLPQPIFDTQLAAPYLGLPEQLGYAALASELLGVKLEKSHTRTDWSLRPLSAAQLRYATDDVTYLARLYPLLLARLVALDRRAWVDEDMATLSKPELYDPAPEDAWVRIGGGSQLNEDQTAVLRSLAAWRERLAREQDCPRNWIIKDEILLELARQRPKNAEGIRLVRGVDDRIAKRFGAELLNCLLEAAEQTPRITPQLKSKMLTDSAAQDALLDIFSALLRLKADEHSLNPATIASRKELREFIADPESSPLLRGWRSDVAGRDLLAMLTGEKTLKVVGGVLQVSASGP